MPRPQLSPPKSTYTTNNHRVHPVTSTYFLPTPVAALPPSLHSCLSPALGSLDWRLTGTTFHPIIPSVRPLRPKKATPTPPPSSSRSPGAPPYQPPDPKRNSTLLLTFRFHLPTPLLIPKHPTSGITSSHPSIIQPTLFHLSLPYLPTNTALASTFHLAHLVIQPYNSKSRRSCCVTLIWPCPACSSQESFHFALSLQHLNPPLSNPYKNDVIDVLSSCPLHLARCLSLLIMRTVPNPAPFFDLVTRVCVPDILTRCHIF